MAITEIWTEELDKVFQTLEGLGIPSEYLDSHQNFVLDICWTCDDLVEVTEIIFDDWKASEE